MSDLAVSLVWAAIQICIVSAAGLIVACLARGRYPQMLSALLSGACGICLVVGVLPLLPPLNWSWANWRAADPAIARVSGGTESTSMPTSGDASSSKSVAASMATATNASSGETAIQTMARHRPSEVREQNDRTADKRSLTSGLLGPISWSPELWMSSPIWQRGPRSSGMALFLQSADTAIRQFTDSGWGSWVLWPVLAALLVTPCVSIGLWCLSFWHARRIVATATPISDERVSRLVQRLSRIMGSNIGVQLAASDQIAVGATVRWRCPTILLNPEWRSWSAAELQAVLAHELAHALRRDYLWVLISSLIQSMLVMHPGIQLLVRRLRMEQELAADQIAAGTFVNGRAYGRALAQLTLANQQSPRAPSPMLAAGQICVLRRITMLKQGRLKPRLRPSRWLIGLTLITLAAALPLSGVRGDTQSTTSEQTNGTPDTSTVASSAQSAQEGQPDAPESSGAEPAVGQENVGQASDSVSDDAVGETAEAERLPPLVLDGGITVYRQAHATSEQLGPTGGWLASMLWQIMVGELPPEECILYGSGAIRVSWEDATKQRGRLFTDYSVRCGENTRPEQLSNLLESPTVSPLKRDDQQVEIDGRIAHAYTYRHVGEQVDGEDLPRTWTIDDQNGFLRADTLDELRNMLAQPQNQPEIPSEFQADFDQAAYGVVYPDCRDWYERSREFFEGSQKQEAQMILPVIADLVCGGFFVLPGEKPQAVLRGVYADEVAAGKAKSTVEGLLGLAKLAEGVYREDTSKLLAWCGGLQVQQTGCQLWIVDTIGVPLQIAAAEIYDQSGESPGWEEMANIEVHQEGETTQVSLRSAGMGLLPSMLYQSVSAERYRGRRVRLSCQVDSDAQDSAGVILWTCDARDVPQVVRAAGTAGEIDVAELMRRGLVDAQADSDGGLGAATVELDIPRDARCVSLGVFCKQATMTVQDITLTDLGPSSSASNGRPAPQGLSAYANPNRPIHAQPTNLEFEPATSETDEDVATRRVATQPNTTDKR